MLQVHYNVRQQGLMVRDAANAEASGRSTMLNHGLLLREGLLVSRMARAHYIGYLNN